MTFNNGMQVEWSVGYVAKILLPLRGFQAELYAAYVAIQIAEFHHAHIKVFHVEKKSDHGIFDFDPVYEELTKFARRRKVVIEFERVKGESARKQIIRKIKEEKFDLIIIGTRRQHGFPLGSYEYSNAVEIAALKKRPVLLVAASPFDDNEFHKPQFDKILLPIGPGELIDEWICRIAIWINRNALFTAVNYKKVPEITVLSAAKEIIDKEDDKFLKVVGTYNQILGRAIVPKILVGHSFQKSIAYMAKREHTSLIIIGIRGSVDKLPLKHKSVWKVPQLARVPTIFVFLPVATKTSKEMI